MKIIWGGYTMSKYEDFDLDLKEIRNKGVDVTPAATDGFICSYISSKIVDTIIKTIVKTYRECTEGCPTPSIDYEHRSCRGPLNDGTIQINC